ncbi:dCMP deaminase family protein [Erysipelothrix urinaevulpis]|uniref:deoxycytidylate deaminase n=1 Tax=Erysipelothrix urinaevulpis TaxID=2683717 RepID=UPI00135C1477|nr:dCMP deaminase family protein [Erysipelothrix urinaevulpis]
MSKRNDAITWDQYFMGLAHLSAKRSKDPSTQVGAVIVNEKKKIVGIGYNGLPTGLNDDDFPWSRDGDFLDSKYAYVVHAELNAILNASGDLGSCSIYVSLFPCNECAKAIIQSGIKEIVYESDKYAQSHSVQASKAMLKGAGVELRQLDETIELKLTVAQ